MGTVIDVTDRKRAEEELRRSEAYLAEAQKLFQMANLPKKLWIVMASDHRFSGNSAEFDQRLLEAIQWVRQNQPQWLAGLDR